MRQMTLAGTNRTDDQRRAIRPSDSPIDELDCSSVRAADEKILQPQGGAVRQIEDELLRLRFHLALEGWTGLQCLAGIDRTVAVGTKSIAYHDTNRRRHRYSNQCADEPE